MPQINNGPVFPPEIERIIVEMVAQDIRFPLFKYRVGCVQLQLSAHRFRQWIIPFTYRVIHSRDINFEVTRSGVDGFFAKLDVHGKHTTHVILKQRIFIDYSVNVKLSRSLLEGILERCHNIEDLIIWQHRAWFFPDETQTNSATTPLNVKRLSVMVNLFPPRLTKILIPNIYTSITHLWLVNFGIPWSDMAEFRSLTHLCINQSTVCFEPPLIEFVHQKDAGPCPLQVILLASVSCLERTKMHHWEDPRFVFLEKGSGTSSDLEMSWLNSAPSRGPDFWTFAERIIHCRKKGYFLRPIVEPRMIVPVLFVLGIRERMELNEEGRTWWFDQEPLA